MKTWKLLIIAAVFGLGLLQLSCAGSHVTVGVGVAGPWGYYPGYPGPPVVIGRPYPGVW